MLPDEPRTQPEQPDGLFIRVPRRVDEILHIRGNRKLFSKIPAPEQLEYAGIRKMAALRPEWTFVWLAAEAGLLRGLDHSLAREVIVLEGAGPDQNTPSLGWTWRHKKDCRDVSQPRTDILLLAARGHQPLAGCPPRTQHTTYLELIGPSGRGPVRTWLSHAGHALCRRAL